MVPGTEARWGLSCLSSAQRCLFPLKDWEEQRCSNSSKPSGTCFLLGRGSHMTLPPDLLSLPAERAFPKMHWTAWVWQATGAGVGGNKVGVQTCSLSDTEQFVVVAGMVRKVGSLSQRMNLPSRVRRHRIEELKVLCGLAVFHPKIPAPAGLPVGSSRFCLGCSCVWDSLLAVGGRILSSPH